MATDERAMRIQPSPKIGIVVFVLYVVLFTGLFLVGGVDYDDVAASTGNVIRAVVIPVWAGVLVLLAIVGYLRWWRPVYRDEDRSPRWTLAIPVIFAIAIVAGLASADWSGRDTSFYVWLAFGTLGVGIAEETLARGILLTGLRGGMGEVGAWFWSSLLFGVLHGANIVLGQDVGPTIQQIVFAFLFGSVLYACRRSTGLLLTGIVLHALWDFSTFVEEGSRTVEAAAVQSLIGYGAVILTIIALIARSFFRHTATADAEPALVPAG